MDRHGPYTSSLLLKETVRVELFRGARGFYAETPDETPDVTDLIVGTGQIYIARRIAGGDNQTVPGSAMAYMAIGTVSTAPASANTVLTGEIKRKALAVNSNLATNIYTAVCTFGGAAETIQSIAIVEAGLFNHASSGQQYMMQRVTFAAVTLADSDLLRITLETNVGSN